MATNDVAEMLRTFATATGTSSPAPMSSELIVGYGAANQAGESMSLRAYRVRPSFIKDTAVFTSIGRRTALPTLAVGGSPIFGSFEYFRITHLARTVLMLQAIYTTSGSLTHSCAVFVEVHDDAPLIAIAFKVQPGPNCTIEGNQVPAFRGRGYLLGTQELEDLGYKFPSPSWPSMNMDEGDLEDKCVILELQPGATPERPTLVEVPSPVDPSRTVVVPKAYVPKRRINLSRGSR